MLSKERNGKLFIVSAPSGGGKTSLCRRVLKEMSGIVPSISFTTRKPRLKEINGEDYHFIDEKNFKEKIRDHFFAEWAIVHDYYYGTSKSFVEDQTSRGVDVLLSIDVQGGSQLCKRYKNAVTIFIHTPSFEELKKRLIKRRSESVSSLEKRLGDAEIELQESKSYQYQIINDVFEKALSELISVIELERNKR